MRRRRTVVEDVAEMAAAMRTVHFSADHAVGTIHRRFHRAFDGVVEAGPACAAFEFQFRSEKLLVAAGAGEMAGALLLPLFAFLSYFVFG